MSGKKGTSLHSQQYKKLIKKADQNKKEKQKNAPSKGIGKQGKDHPEGRSRSFSTWDEGPLSGEEGKKGNLVRSQMGKKSLHLCRKENKSKKGGNS